MILVASTDDVLAVDGGRDVIASVVGLAFVVVRGLMVVAGVAGNAVVVNPNTVDVYWSSSEIVIGPAVMFAFVSLFG